MAMLVPAGPCTRGVLDAVMIRCPMSEVGPGPRARGVLDVVMIADWIS